LENKLKQPTFGGFGGWAMEGKKEERENKKQPASLKLVPFRKHHKNMNNQETIHINL
jgi:hypothetical protein